MVKLLIQVIKFEFKLFFRNMINLFFLLVFPTMMLVIFGNIFGNMPVAQFGGFGTIDVSIPAYAGMIISVNGLMNLPLTICEYREKKVLKRYKATPLNPVLVVISQLIVNLIMTVVGMAVLVLFAWWLFDVNFYGNIVVTALIFLLSVLSVFALGFVIASVSPNIKVASAVANLVYFPMLFLTGATIPLALMPELMQNIAQFLPVTHVVNVLINSWTGMPTVEVGTSILVLTVVTMVGFGVSFKFFKWE